MSKKKNKKLDDLRKLSENSKRKSISAESKRLFALMLVNTVALMLIYFYFVKLEIIAVMFIYMGLTVALSIAFIIYNRGLPQNKIDEESLPFNWSAAQKREYIEDRAARLKKSRWMLTLILPLFVTLCADFMIIETIPFFKNAFFG